MIKTHDQDFSDILQIYSRVVLWLTDFETLRTQSEYDNSINIKLFSLQFVNYYSSIIYIAFFKGRLVGRPGDYNMAFGARQEEVLYLFGYKMGFSPL